MFQPGFAELVELACHDLRTPLATVNGFAKTMLRAGDLGGRDVRYVEMIDEAATDMTRLVAQLGLAARIAAGHYSPELLEADTLGLASSSGDGRISAHGEGTTIETDPDVVGRALTALAVAALRFGEADSVEWAVAGRKLALSPLTGGAAPVLDGSAPRDLGALVARSVITDLGGGVEVDGETLRVRL